MDIILAFLFLVIVVPIIIEITLVLGILALVIMLPLYLLYLIAPPLALLGAISLLTYGYLYNSDNK